MFSHLQESRAPSYIKVIWEGKYHTSKCPLPSLLLPRNFIPWAWSHIVWNIVVVSHVSCPDCVLSQLLVHSPPSHWQAEKSLTAQQQLKYQCISKILVTLLAKHSTILATRKNTQAQPKPGQHRQCFCVHVYIYFSFVSYIDSLITGN